MGTGIGPSPPSRPEERQHDDRVKQGCLDIFAASRETSIAPSAWLKGEKRRRNVSATKILSVIGRLTYGIQRGIFPLPHHLQHPHHSDRNSMSRSTRSSTRSKEQPAANNPSVSAPAAAPKRRGPAKGVKAQGGDEASVDAPSEPQARPKPKPRTRGKKDQPTDAPAVETEAEKARKRALSAADEEAKKPRKKKQGETPAVDTPPQRSAKRGASDDDAEGDAPKAKKAREAADRVAPNVDDEAEAEAEADAEVESDTNVEGDEFTLVDVAAEKSAAEVTEDKAASKKAAKLAAQLEAGEPKRLRDSKLNKPGSRPKKSELFDGTVQLDEDEDGSDLSDLTDIEKAPVPKEEKSAAASTDKGKGKQVAEAPATAPRTSAAKPSAPSASAAEKGKGKAVVGPPAATRTPAAKSSAPSASTSSSSKSAAPKVTNSAAPKSAPAQTPKRQQKITAAFEATPVKVKQEPGTPVNAQSGSSKPSNSKSKIPKVENEAGPSIQVKSEPGVSVKQLNGGGGGATWWWSTRRKLNADGGKIDGRAWEDQRSRAATSARDAPNSLPLSTTTPIPIRGAGRALYARALSSVGPHLCTWVVPALRLGLCASRPSACTHYAGCGTAGMLARQLLVIARALPSKVELDEDVKPDVKGFKRKDYTPPVYLRIDSDGNEFIEISSDEDEGDAADANNAADANDANDVEQADDADDGNDSDVVQELTAEEVAALNPWNAAELQHHVDARAHHLANGKIGGVSSHSSPVVKKAFSDAVNTHHPIILLLGDRGMYPRRNDKDDDELTDDDIARAGAADAFLLAIDKGDQFAPLRARCDADPDFLDRCAEAVNERRSQFRNKLAKLVPIVLERAYDLTRLTQAKKVDETAIMNAIAALLQDDAFVYDSDLQRIAGSDNRFKYVIKKDMDDVPYWHPAFHEYLACAVMGKAQGGHPLKATLFPDAMYEHKHVKKGDKEVPVVTLGFAVTMIEYGLKNWATGSYTYVELKGSQVKDTYWRHIEALQSYREEDSDFLNATLWRAYQQARAWSRPGQRKEKARAHKPSANAAKIAALLGN
ncbi:hypothetical protein PENSPDRAFT_670152 [Peniophora sp. CONT]|nr:hypothetical protein PENSPDRAFT_670152 [Peniophora sp. CONT]